LFGRLRDVLGRGVKSISEAIRGKVAYKEIGEGELSDILEEIKLSLIEAEVAFDVAERIVESVKARLVGSRIPRSVKVEDYVREAFRQAILSLLPEGGPDLISEASKRRPGERPYVVVFLGVNGVGKTTTIAKLAYLALQSGITPVLAAADTFRAGAQEQLEHHAEKLGVPLIRGEYGRDPASVAFDAIEYARARNYKLVLVDTAGRMHTDYDLMEELRKIVKVSKPDARVLVVDALTGNDAVEQARMFNEGVGVDGTVLTKVDADVKGGVALSVAAITGSPILYIGTGQGYSDLEKFDRRKFVESLLG
jgi:fused signal recognition particle receptor